MVGKGAVKLGTGGMKQVNWVVRHRMPTSEEPARKLAVTHAKRLRPG